MSSNPVLRLPRGISRTSHVAVLAASSPSERLRIEEAARSLEARGMTVTLFPNVDHQYRGYLAGSDDERVDAINRAFRSDRFDAFMFARGGYGAMRILDRIDFDALASNPRPVIGFSDVTAIHQALAVKAGVASFHGPLLNLDWHDGLSPTHEQWFWSMLAGEAPLVYRFGAGQVLSDGVAEGTLFGGCLTLTTALASTPYDFWVDDGIWFWEDVGERVYQLDRMLTLLRLSGRLRRIRGVVIGKLKDCGTSDAEVHSLLNDFFGASGIPVVRDLPFGHHGDNLLMPIGARVRISTSECTMTITEPGVERR
jgi:muramoyltetrapeptide carboxypeptidase